jgi:hypothetical protein
MPRKQGDANKAVTALKAAVVHVARTGENRAGSNSARSGEVLGRRRRHQHDLRQFDEAATRQSG